MTSAINQVSATAITIDYDASSSSLEYGAGYKATLIIHNLTITTDYTLIIANNTPDRYNISWEAIHATASIDYDYSGALTDANNNSITDIQLVLLNNATQEILLNIYMPLTFASSVSAVIETLLSLAINIFYFLLAVFVFIVLLAGAKQLR